MNTYKIGSRWQSLACETEVIVIRAVTQPVDLQCGGWSMCPHGKAGERRALSRPGGSLLGKRYTDRGSGLIVLVTRPGEGQLSVGDAALDPLEPQLLPSSD